MKQQDRRQQTIQRLLDSTKALIAEKGCDAITMKDMMERSGLSKGAIFHYVRSKDEIFAWVLQERLERMNEQFEEEAGQSPPTFEGPMQKLANHFPALADPQELTNKVFAYLLGKADHPVVAEVLQKFYDQSVQFSMQWIKSGQQHGVISTTIDAQKTAEMFVLLSCGIRMRSAIPGASTQFHVEDFTSFVSSQLQFNS